MSDFRKNEKTMSDLKKKWWETSQNKQGKRGKLLLRESLVRPLWRAAGSGAKAPPLATRPKQRVLEKISGQLEAWFQIFLTLGSIKQSNTHTCKGFWRISQGN